MENELKHTKWNIIAGIMGIIVVLYHIISQINSGMIVGTINVHIAVASILFLCVILFMKKHNYLLLIPFAIFVLLNFFNFFMIPETINTSDGYTLYITVETSFQVVGILNLIANVCLCVICFLSLVQKNDNKLKFVKWIWFIPAIIVAVSFIICYNGSDFFVHTEYDEYGLSFSIISPLFSSLRLLYLDLTFYPYMLLDWIPYILMYLFVGMWIVNPYVKPKSDKTVSAYGYCSMLKHVLLLLFTIGIWQFIWTYRTTSFLNQSKDEEYRDPATKLLLCIFVPFYYIYWTYKSAQRIDRLASKKQISSDISTLCLIMAIVFPLVAYIVMQDKINSIVTANEIDNNTDNIAKQLESFKELLEKGVITQEEFDAKKKQLLGL